MRGTKLTGDHLPTGEAIYDLHCPGCGYKNQFVCKACKDMRQTSEAVAYKLSVMDHREVEVQKKLDSIERREEKLEEKRNSMPEAEHKRIRKETTKLITHNKSLNTQIASKKGHLKRLNEELKKVRAQVKKAEKDFKNVVVVDEDAFIRLQCEHEMQKQQLAGLKHVQYRDLFEDTE